MTAPQEYVLAVDGGATKCLAVLVDTCQGVVGVGRAGPCNSHSVGSQEAARALTEAITSACSALPAGRRIRAAAFSLASGIGQPPGPGGGPGHGGRGPGNGRSGGRGRDRGE